MILADGVRKTEAISAILGAMAMEYAKPRNGLKILYGRLWRIPVGELPEIWAPQAEREAV